MKRYKYSMAMFLESAPLKVAAMVFYLMFLGLYIFTRKEAGLDLFRLFQVQKTSGYFFESLMENMNWVLFYFTAIIFPLDSFQNLLLKISVFENIRRNQKKKNFKFFWYQRYHIAAYLQ